MADFKQLKAQLMSLQQAPVKPRLSERNLVEVVKKLMDTGGLTLYFSSNGKEFLTPSQLEAEILAEVRRVGRVSLIDLPGTLGMNIEFVEKHTTALVAKRKDLMLVDGQLMSDAYIDLLAQEVDSLIALSGQVQISELARKFSLPSDFLRSHLSSRQGTLLHGQVKDAQIVTDVYLQRHYAKLRGALRGCTEPLSLKAFDQSLAASQTEEMIKKKEIRGSLAGSVFTPAVYTETIANNLRTMYESSSVIDYRTVRRVAHLQTDAEAKKLITAVAPGGLHLETCYIETELLAELKGKVSQALSDRGVVKCRAQLDLPDAIDISDLGHLASDVHGVFIFEDTIWAESAVAEVAATFEPMVKRIAEEMKVASSAPQPAKGGKKKGRGEALSLTEVINHLKKARSLDKYQLSDSEAGYEALADRLYGKLLEMIDVAKESGRPAPAAAKKREPAGVDLMEEFSLLQLYVKAVGIIGGRYANVNPLQVHLSKTLLPNFYVKLLNVQLQNQGLPAAENLKFADRGSFLAALPQYLQQVFARLGDCVRERRLEEFVTCLLEVKQDLPAVTLQALDKKKERAFLHKQRLLCKENLAQALTGNNDLATAYYAAILRVVDTAGALLCIPQEPWAMQVALGAYQAFLGGEDDPLLFIQHALANDNPERLAALRDSLQALVK